LNLLVHDGDLAGRAAEADEAQFGPEFQRFLERNHIFGLAAAGRFMPSAIIRMKNHESAVTICRGRFSDYMVWKETKCRCRSF